ncbi:glycosyltransferase family 9 protein [Phenylobacterium montanum]|uniref:Glycosyltransferase family 9 protein n=1 Tax=Phenylobacterium montanum TaxID=2823693 RepID=A0A975G1N7_9CAUL|nr:glycosyltransferase family 9 protein [Caulobacter sp. S6]QUD89091.1 hypothetical protein KCG34_04170 [Caulobacter sp. S6]
MADKILDALSRPDLRELEMNLDRFLAIGVNHAGHPIARPTDCRAMTDLFSATFSINRRHFETRHSATTERFFQLLYRFEASAVRSYGSEIVRLDLLKTRVLLSVGRPEEAAATVGPWAERPYRIEGDFKLVLEALKLDLAARMNCGQIEDVRRLAFARVIFLAGSAQRRVFGLTKTFYQALAILDSSSETEHWVVPILAKAARFHLRGQRRGRRLWLVRYLRRVLAQAALISADALLFLAIKLPHRALRVQLEGANSPSPRPLRGEANDQEPAILVTRAMGGLGDIAMMTPGLRALALRYNRRVAFAIPAKFHPALAGDPHYDLIDSDGFIDLAQYRRWRNLTACPAARYESRRTPNIKRGRVELFARGMGVKLNLLNRYGQTIQGRLSQAQRAVRDELRLRAPAGRRIVGVALHSREEYRDYPAMGQLLRELADRYFVIAIHTTPTPIPDSPNIVGWFSKPLDAAIAAVAACDTFISVDTALFHFAGGFGVPTVGIFGPTSAKVRSTHLTNVVPVEAPGLVCRPCWRNEDEICQISGNFDSVCMASIRSQEILSAVERALMLAPERSSAQLDAPRGPEPHPERAVVHS